MAPFPAPETGILLTHFVVSEDIARSRDLYANVLGGEVVSESPAVVALAIPPVLLATGFAHPAELRQLRALYERARRAYPPPAGSES